MRKSRLSIALMTSLLGVCALAGCDPVEYSPKGNLISYTIGDGDKHTISAEEIFVKYYNDSDKYQSIFDAIKSIVIRNYFTIEEEVTLPDNSKIKLGLPQLPELEAAANKSVSSDVHDATTRANTNSTSYDKEFDKILKSKGVKTKEELYEKYLDEEKTNKFNENYYKYFLDEIKKGYDDGVEGTSELEKFWTGYFDNMLPYHVSHILVNVSDSSETNYYNGTISETDVQKLYTVVKMLENKNNSTDTFKSIAKLWSDDANGPDSSKEYYGDLGVMTYAESYVDEFKLGIYAFENLYGNSAAQSSNIDIPGTYNYNDLDQSTGLESQFFEAVNNSFDGITIGKNKAIPAIKMDVFEDLYKVKDVTKDKNGDEVMENSSLVYPRNVIYNKYLNRHSFAFITGDADTGDFGNVTKPGSTNVYSKESATGIHTYTDDDGYPLLSGNKILSTVVAGQMRPILMVRAGGGNYQGIHFIVINRDPFQVGEDNNGVNMEEYYHTYKLPTDASKVTYFPQDENKVFKKTYANFATDEYEKVNKRIDTFTSQLKEFDKEKLSKFFFKKYAEKEGLKISDPALDAALQKWIDTTVASKEEADIESWETSWTNYIATLRKQNSERNSLMSELCKVGFEKDPTTTIANEAAFIGLLGEYGITSGTDEYTNLLGRYNAHATEIKTVADLFNVKGAPCNDGKPHK